MWQTGRMRSGPPDKQVSIAGGKILFDIIVTYDQRNTDHHQGRKGKEQIHY